MIRSFTTTLAIFAFSSLSIAQTYWVNSTTVTHSGGWPNVHQDTRTGMFLSNGYTWDAVGDGGLYSPGGLQTDGSHSKVDAYFRLIGGLTVFGSASSSKDQWMYRSNIDIKFKIRCSYNQTPPTPGSPVFDMQVYTESNCNLVNSPFSNQGKTDTWYIPIGGSSATNMHTNAHMPGGTDTVTNGWNHHRNETGSAPSGWTNIGTNLWETEVTVPYPSDPDDQNMYVYADASANQSGSMINSWGDGTSIYHVR